MCEVDLEEGQGGGFCMLFYSAQTLRMRAVSDYPGFDNTNIIAYRSVCKCCIAGFLLSVSGRRVEASLRYTVSLVGICLNV